MREERPRSRDCLTGKSIFKLCLRDKLWKYRGEGNANLVIALPKERLILRLHKWERGKEVTEQVEAEEEKRVWREVLFCRSVMVPLLGSAYIQPPKIGFLDHVELIKLDAALKPLRPVYRLHKGIKFGYVTIYPDYALLPSSLEISCPHHHYLRGYNYCTKLPPVPLQSIENQNYGNVKEVGLQSKIMLTDLHCMKGASNYSLNDLESEESSDDDIFIENYQNINHKSVEIPSAFYSRSETFLNGYCQLGVGLCLSRLQNCGQNRNLESLRRFSTGSDFNYVSNLSFVKNPPQMVSSSAPVYSQLILDMNSRRNPVFCVEIKPKQGWIPSMDRFNAKCTFCLNQYLKLSKGLVETISGFCPLDLFSGNEMRIRNALKNLLSTPQNNLKLFRDGVMIYSEDMKTDLYSVLNEWFKSSSNHLTRDDNLKTLIDKFCDLVVNALTTDLTNGEKFPDIKDSSEPECSDQENNSMLCDLVGITSSTVIRSLSGHHFAELSQLQSCDWTSHPLPSNCILDRILKIQQLEQFGAENIYKRYKNICPEESDYEYVVKLCEYNRPVEEGVLKLDPVQRYLLATTAKDCSILVAFQRTSNNFCLWPYLDRHNIMQDADGISYVWSIGISDLDPKPLSCIEKHRKRDMDVVSSFMEYLKNRPI